MNHYEYIFTPTNLKCCQIVVVYFTQKMIKNVIFNKSKNTSVRFFIYIFLLSVCNISLHLKKWF